jgi:glutathione S-transferase
MKLYIANKNYSSWSLRPWLLMRAMGIDFEEKMILLDRPDTRSSILAVAPSGKVPILVDGDLTIWDTLAITEYLAEQFPSIEIWPILRSSRALARSLVAEMHSGFAALRSAMPMNLRASLPGRGHTAAALADIARVVEIWEDCRRRFGGAGPFLCGHFCAVDAFYAPVVTRFVTYGVTLPPACADYVETILALPAMRQWKSDALAEAGRASASEIYA